MARSEEGMQRRLAQLAMKAGQLEHAVQRQFALNEAAAEKILRLQQELEDQGSMITALVARAGGRVEFTMEELKGIQPGTKVAIAYPDPEKGRETFVLAVTHENPEEAEARALANLEERLRRAGISDGEIEQLKRGIDAAATQAGELFDGPHPDSPDAGDLHPDAGSVDPRAEASALVDASGRPL